MLVLIRLFCFRARQSKHAPEHINQKLINVSTCTWEMRKQSVRDWGMCLWLRENQMEAEWVGGCGDIRIPISKHRYWNVNVNAHDNYVSPTQSMRCLPSIERHSIIQRITKQWSSSLCRVNCRAKLLPMRFAIYVRAAKDHRANLAKTELVLCKQPTTKPNPTRICTFRTRSRIYTPYTFFDCCT
jgi:hypothetical protein